MGYSKDNLDELMASKSLATKQKISEFLRIDCKMYANLGTDSTNKEIKEVKAISKRIYKHIHSHNQHYKNMPFRMHHIHLRITKNVLNVDYHIFQ